MAKRPIDKHALGVLEFASVCEILADYAAGELGRAEAVRLYPSSDQEWIADRIAETSELKQLLEDDLRLPFAGLSDIRPTISQVHTKEPVLGPAQLLQICDTLEAAAALKRFFADLDRAVPHLLALAEQIETFEEITDAIDRCIQAEDTVCDDASPKLRQIRRRVDSLRNEIERKFEAILTAPGMRDAIENDRVITRSGRRVIPIKANYRSYIRGAVLDRSNTGATLYIEPYDLHDLGNQLEDELYAEQGEINRVLWQLTRKVLDRRIEIARTVGLLGRIDLIYAKARFSIDYQMAAPAIEPGSYLRLNSARHPLLIHLVGQDSDLAIHEVFDKVVPIDVHLGDNFDMLIVTGPNTGGKTATLKTIGLLILMAQSGMHVPAGADCRIPVYKQLFADIGDEQSLQQSLSTFSSHMRHVVHILQRANERSLVLLDELGAGTDPAEGAALSKAILDRLNSVHAKVVVTTHLGDLKNYAYSTKRVENAAVEFDVETLAPTFRLRIGQPGSSNAIAIARRLGMPVGLAKQAQDGLSAQSRNTSDLINQVQSIRKQTEQDRNRMQELLEAAAARQRQADELLRQVKQQHELSMDQADRHIDESMRSVRRLAEIFVAEMQNAPKHWSQQAALLGERIAEAAAGTTLAQRHKQFIESVRIGDRVYLPQLKSEGFVRRIHKKRKTMTLSVNNKEAEIPFEGIVSRPEHGK